MLIDWQNAIVFLPEVSWKIFSYAMIKTITIHRGSLKELLEEVLQQEEKRTQEEEMKSERNSYNNQKICC